MRCRGAIVELVLNLSLWRGVAAFVRCILASVDRRCRLRCLHLLSLFRLIFLCMFLQGTVFQSLTNKKQHIYIYIDLRSVSSLVFQRSGHASDRCYAVCVTWWSASRIWLQLGHRFGHIQGDSCFALDPGTLPHAFRGCPRLEAELPLNRLHSFADTGLCYAPV